jgi:redox-sensitive bicupin YhaK (pirin superfamily)
MLRAIESGSLGRGQHGWLDSHFHFSFDEYYNPENINFGVLRVLNDDTVLPGTGFDLHPHKDMEIISYVIDGEITHADSMGNEHVLTRGQAQYMSAGTGVWHSEHNRGQQPLRFFQIWILPDGRNYQPNYGDYRFEWDSRINRWMHLATSVNNPGSEAPIRIHQDANVYATYLQAGHRLPLELTKDRQAYLVLAEGKARVEGIGLHARDAMEIIGQSVEIEAIEDAHILVVEMVKG